jgi:hypothetical protein
MRNGQLLPHIFNLFCKELDLSRLLDAVAMRADVGTVVFVFGLLEHHGPRRVQV